MTQGRLPTRRRELNGLPSWWNHRLTFQAVRQWPCVESFQIFSWNFRSFSLWVGISYVCPYVWGAHACAQPQDNHGCSSSPVLRQNPSLTWNSESLLFLPTKHWDLQACTTKPSFFRWVLGSALGSSCLHGKLFTDWIISRGPEFFFSVWYAIWGYV